MLIIFERHLFGSWDPDSYGSLETVIDPPLKTGQSTNHDNTSSQSTPDALEAKFGKNFSSTLGRFRHLGNNSVSRMRYNSTSNTGDVTRGESDAQVSALGVGFLGSSEDFLVESFFDLK